jgi:hypothetical protein
VSNPKSKIKDPKSLRVSALAGNQNASKHPGGSRRISATVPVELAEWLAQQPNQSAAVVAALQQVARPQMDHQPILKALERLYNAADVYAAQQDRAPDERCGLVQPITVAEGNELLAALLEASTALYDEAMHQHRGNRISPQISASCGIQRNPKNRTRTRITSHPPSLGS